ncbi:MAG: phage baseplate assembly protein W [Bacteroidetes bacterium]|nr:MAG: phage baseplate assembly protein W [Bacteroidota bacterium]
MANEEKLNDSFLGTGWSFPPQFSDISGDVIQVSDLEDIRQSLVILLSTSLGERIMQPAYGCNLRDYMFESMNTTLITYLKSLIYDAILFYEARITVNKLEIDTSSYLEGILNISIDFTVKSYNSRYSIVFPYYINESSIKTA